jgi:hypothetical protein
MKMIAGSILILAAAVLLAARWLGLALRQNSTYTGTPESEHIFWAMVVLAICGIGAIVWGANEPRRP